VISPDEQRYLLLNEQPALRTIDAFIWLMVAAGIGYVALVLQYAMAAAQQFWMQHLMVSIASVVKIALTPIGMPISIPWSRPAMF
jgi:hypothetical protein